MKKFFFKSLCFFGPLIFGFLFLNFLYKSTNVYKYENFVYKFKNLKDGIELVNLGASHSEQAFYYGDEIQINAANMALSSQPYFYDCAILRQYSPHLKKGCVVVFEIPYCYISGRTDFNDIRMRYYRVLSKKYMDKWDLNQFVSYAVFPVLSAKEKLFYIVKDKKIGQEDENRATAIDVEHISEIAQRRYESWNKLDKGEYGYKKNMGELSDCIEFCLKNDLKPVLIHTPLIKAFNDIYDKDISFQTTFKRFMNEICEKYPEVKYFDYTHDVEFTERFELFFDADHLNVHGAKIFTEKFLDELRQNGLLAW